MIIPLLFSLLTNVSAAEPATIAIRVSGGTRIQSVFGRVIPALGAVHVQLSDGKGIIQSMLAKPGDKVVVGAPLFKYSCHKEKPCVIHAAYSGVLDEVLKTAGSEVDIGDGLVSLVDPAALAIRLDVPQKLLKYLSVGETLTLHESGGGNAQAKGKIIEIMPSLGVGDTTRGVRVSLLSQLDGLRRDTIVTADVHVPLEGNGIRISANAIAYSNGTHYVIKKSGDKFQAVPVHIISETADDVWIVSLHTAPLNTGDVILAENTIFYLTQALEQNNGAKD